jgi:hypothetical protein
MRRRRAVAMGVAMMVVMGVPVVVVMGMRVAHPKMLYYNITKVYRRRSYRMMETEGSDPELRVNKFNDL